MNIYFVYSKVEKQEAAAVAIITRIYIAIENHLTYTKILSYSSLGADVLYRRFGVSDSL